MIACLDALVTWHQAAVSTVPLGHLLSWNGELDNYPQARVEAKTQSRYAVAVSVPVEITETVTLAVEEQVSYAALAPIVAALRALDGVFHVSADGVVRIHHHRLVDERYDVTPKKQRQVVLAWEVVASWQ